MDSPPRSSKPSHQGHKAPSSAELLSSAKLVAEAARFTFTHETDKVDKARVAEAAEDLLTAASQYGNLEGSGVGSYLEKAETYLHSYHSSNSAHSTTSSPAAHSTAVPHKPAPSSGGPHSEGSGGFGDHLSGGPHSEGSGGFGDYLKMAEGFMKKH